MIRKAARQKKLLKVETLYTTSLQIHPDYTVSFIAKARLNTHCIKSGNSL